MENFVLQVFNRYGQMIYQTADPSTGWNGYYKGEKALTGTYVWMASYVNMDTQQRTQKKGFVVLIR
jgi:gliding motility-associated-like protein